MLLILWLLLPLHFMAATSPLLVSATASKAAAVVVAPQNWAIRPPPVTSPHEYIYTEKSARVKHSVTVWCMRCSGGGGNRTSRSCINSRICVVGLARFLYGCCRLYRLLPPIFALRPVVNFARVVLSLNQWLANYPLCICLCLREGDRKKGTSARLIIARTIVRSSGWRCCCRSSSSWWCHCHCLLLLYECVWASTGAPIHLKCSALFYIDSDDRSVRFFYQLTPPVSVYWSQWAQESAKSSKRWVWSV